MNEATRDLREFLDSMGEGCVEEQRSEVLSRLDNCWDQISGSKAERTSSDKLHRAEDLQWKKPILSFVLERHGKIRYGSSRASEHRWSVDVDAGTASVDTSSDRNLVPNAPKFTKEQASEIAKEVAEQIISGAKDGRFRIKGNGHAVVTLKACLGNLAGRNEQTASGRRKRMKTALIEQMAQRGWKVVPQENNSLTFEKESE